MTKCSVIAKTSATLGLAEGLARAARVLCTALACALTQDAGLLFTELSETPVPRGRTDKLSRPPLPSSDPSPGRVPSPKAFRDEHRIVRWGPARCLLTGTPGCLPRRSQEPGQPEASKGCRQAG